MYSNKLLHILHNYLNDNIYVKKIFVISGLKKSENFILIKHLITQLPTNEENILFINDNQQTLSNYTQYIQEQLFYNKNINSLIMNSMFHNTLIDMRLIKNINNYHKCHYIIFSLEDKNIAYINAFIIQLKQYNIKYSVTFVIRDIISIFSSRIEYVLNKIYYENFTKYIFLYNKNNTILFNTINNIKQLLINNIKQNNNTNINNNIKHDINIIKRDINNIKQNNSIKYNKIYELLLQLYNIYYKNKHKYKLINNNFINIINIIPTHNTLLLYNEYNKFINNKYLHNNKLHNKRLNNNIITEYNIFNFNEYLLSSDNNYIFSIIKTIKNDTYINIDIFNSINNIQILHNYCPTYDINDRILFLDNDINFISKQIFKYLKLNVLKDYINNDKQFQLIHKTILSQSKLPQQKINQLKISSNDLQHETQLNIIKQFSNKIKHIYLIFELRLSGTEYFIQHLITQLSGINNILYCMDSSHYSLDSIINDNELYYSMFNIQLIDKHLITSYNQMHNVEYIILKCNDKKLDHINKIIGQIKQCNISYTVIFGIRDYINILCARLNYCINTIASINNYNYVLTNTESIHFKNIMNYINIIKIELFKSRINYNIIYDNLDKFNKYYCAHHNILHKNILLDDINKLQMTSINDTMFNIYISYLSYISTNNIICFNYNEYLFNSSYIVSFIESLNINFNQLTFDNVKNYVPYRYITYKYNDIPYIISLISEYTKLKIFKIICKDKSIKFFNDFIQKIKYNITSPCGT